MAEVRVADIAEKVMVGAEVEVPIYVNDVVDLSGANFDIVVDKDLVEVLSVGDGQIEGVALPLWLLNEPTPGRYRIVMFDLPNPILTGDGTLATLRCKAISAGECLIDIENGVLGDKNAQEILATWYGGSVIFFRRGDINGDGVVDQADIMAIANIVVGLAGFMEEADLNEDGAVNVLDMITAVLLM